MSNYNREQERLRRLRESQLADRDPRPKQYDFRKGSLERERRAAQPFSLKRAWADIPHLWKVPFYGLLLGLLACLLIPWLWDSPWAFWVSLGLIPVFMVIGFMIGRALDTRDELRDLTR